MECFLLDYAWQDEHGSMLVDTTARLMLSVIGAFAEFERALLNERQREENIQSNQESPAGNLKPNCYQNAYLISPFLGSYASP